jgi:ubiquinone/menaquinone biosynthesis C-methylase UbiE
MTFYDFVAPAYGGWAALTEARAHRRAIEILSGCPGKDVLEVAVGTGSEYASLSADPGRRRCVGVDLSGGMLKGTRRRMARVAGRRVLLCRADARSLPFKDKSFDCLLSCYMLDLLPETDLPVVLGEFRRVLREHGVAVLVSMGQQTAMLQRIWMALYRVSPVLVGGCRPVKSLEWLRTSRWDLEARDEITQAGFRSEILVARPSLPASR